METLNIIFLVVAVISIATFSLCFVSIQKNFFSLRKYSPLAVVLLIAVTLFPIFDLKFFMIYSNLRHYITLVLFIISFWLIFRIKLVNSIYLTSLFALIIYTLYILLIAIILLIRGLPFTVAFTEPPYIYYLLYAITTILATIVVYIVAIHTKLVKMISLFKSKHLVTLLTIINISLYVFMLILANGHVYNIEIQWYNFLIIAACLIVILLYNYLLFSMTNVAYLINFKYQSQLLEKQLELQLNHYQEYQQYNENILKFKHDYPGLYDSILRLIHDRKYVEALDILEQMNQEIEEVTSNYIQYSNNYIIDALLRDYRVKFEQINASFSAFVHLPLNLALKDMDLLRLFTNILDNAYEAITKTNQPKLILLETITKDNWQIVKILNSTDLSQNDLVTYKKRQTIKDDKTNHGWGSIIIDEIVNKSGGFTTREIIKEDNLNLYQICLHFKLNKND